MRIILLADIREWPAKFGGCGDCASSEARGIPDLFWAGKWNCADADVSDVWRDVARMVEESLSADGGDFWEICWRSADGFSVDTGDIFFAGVFVEAYGDVVVESAAVCGNGFICCGNGIAGGTSCSVCVEIES